jgi:hypothetical protein
LCTESGLFKEDLGLAAGATIRNPHKGTKADAEILSRGVAGPRPTARSLAWTRGGSSRPRDPRVEATRAGIQLLDGYVDMKNSETIAGRRGEALIQRLRRH